MHDDVRIVLVGTKSRLVWDHLAGNYKFSVWSVQWQSVSISSFRLTEEDIDEASLQGRIPNDLNIPKLKRWGFFGVKEQTFRQLGGKVSFTRPECRLYFPVNILTVNIPQATMPSISCRIQTYINSGLHHDM